MIVDRQTFFKSQKKLQNIPFNQSEEWYEKCGYQDVNCMFFIDDIHDPQIGCWGAVFRRRFIGNHISFSGESYLDRITSGHIKDFYREIINQGFSIIEVSSINVYDIKYEIGIRRAGFLRPFGLLLSPLTIIIKTFEERKTDKDWRRNVRKAIEAQLTFKYIEKPTIKDAETFCTMFSELKEKKSIRYSLSAQSIMKLLTSAYFKLFFVYDQKGETIAGRIIYVRGKKSFDVHASNSNKSRECGAAYYIIDNILDYLTQIGNESFDYGMIPPSATEMDSIYVAKSYSGGIPAQYNSQWVFYKSKFIEYLICGYYFIFNRSSRY